VDFKKCAPLAALDPSPREKECVCMCMRERDIQKFAMKTGVPHVHSCIRVNISNVVLSQNSNEDEDSTNIYILVMYNFCV
jgi:hypothetical protein